MAQITLNSSGVASNGSLVLQTNGTTTAATFDTSQKLTLPNDATISGLTVGKGAGSVSTNTAVGASALNSNTTGDRSVAVGYQASTANTTGINTAVGYQALKTNTTGTENTAIGFLALQANTTGGYNSGIGDQTLYANTTGSNNIAVGQQALASNTTSSQNTVVGYQAGYTNTTAGSLDAFGYQSLYSNSTGTNNASFGRISLYSNTSGSYNTAIGLATLFTNSSGSNNTALGYQALLSNTTASNNTAVGYQAMYSNTTGNPSVAVGYQSLYSQTTGNNNCAVGYYAGNAITTGTYNSLLGHGAGYLITTGGKNTVVGAYNGNQGGLDIRTSSNNVVLSDGDGNPRGLFISGGWFKVQGDGSYQDTAGLYHEFSSAQNNQAFIVASSNTGSSVVGIRSKLPAGASASAKFYLAELSGTGTVFQVISNGNVQNTNNSYGAISDVKLKENIVDATPKLADMMKVQIRNYNLKSDPQHKQIGVIAQELEQVFPSMVEETADTDSEGNDLGTTTKSVKYSVFVPMLIKAIQELKAELDALKAKVGA